MFVVVFRPYVNGEKSTCITRKLYVIAAVGLGGTFYTFLKDSDSIIYPSVFVSNFSFAMQW